MTYLISDIHGERELLLRLLEKIRYSDSDTLIVLGDMIEKGPESVGVMQLISTLPHAVTILGNHEFELLRYYRDLTEEDGPLDFDRILKQLQEFIQGDGSALTWELVDWLETLPLFYETDRFLCVHAGVRLDERQHIIPLSNLSYEDEILILKGRRFKDPDIVVKDPKCVFFGHTPTVNLCNEPRIIAYRRNRIQEQRPLSVSDFYKIHLDTGACQTGVLACFCLETCKCLYVRK